MTGAVDFQLGVSAVGGGAPYLAHHHGNGLLLAVTTASHVNPPVGKVPGGFTVGSHQLSLARIAEARPAQMSSFSLLFP